MNNHRLPFITPQGRFNAAVIFRRAFAIYLRRNGCDGLDWKLAMLSAKAEARGQMQLFQARNGWRVVAMRTIARDVSVPA